MVKRKPLIFWLTGAACLTLAAVFLYNRFGRDRSEPVRRPDMGIGPTTLPDSAASPAEMAGEPLAGTGLKILQTGAGDVFAPPGAVRLYAFGRKIDDETADIIAYTVEAEIAGVEKFYCDRLTKEGYKLMQRKPAMHPGGVSLVFLRKMQRYCVTLRYADKEKKMVKITLVISRPGPGGPN